MRKQLFTLLAALTPFAHPVQAAEPLPWPADGAFPAYPAQPSGGRNWHLYAIGDVTHDSNLFRLSDDTDTTTVLGVPERSDTIYSVGAGVHGDVPVSRQHLLLDIRAIDHRFKRFDFLNYLGHDARIKWNWVFGSRWDGDVGYRNRRYLSSFATLQNRVQDLIDENHAFASATRKLDPRWRVRGALDYYDYKHSATSRDALDSNIVTGTAELQYVTPASNSAGIQAKVSHGNAPNREVVLSQLIDNQYNEYELSATFHWVVTGVSELDGRAGYTRRVHKQISQRDFGGGTFNLQYKWTPLTHTIFRFAGYREIRSYTDVSASYVLTDGVKASAAWAPTYHTVVQASLSNERWQFRGDPGLALGNQPLRRDRVRVAKVAAGYMPWRNTRLELAFEHGRRASNVDTAAYHYNAVSGTVKVQF